jgi:hypothetical protein
MPITKASSNAVAPAAKGDLVVGSATNDSGVLAVGSTSQVLTVDSSTATGLKWAAAGGAGASWSLVNGPSGTQLTAAQTITISGISGADKIMALVNYASAGASSIFTFRLNGDTATNYGTYASNFIGYQTYDKSEFGIYSDQTGTSIRFAKQSNNAGDYSMGGITFTGCNATGFKAFQSVGTGHSDAGAAGETFISQGIYKGTSTISSISIISSVSNFDNGTLWIYTSA